jgi:hypothetical protein
MIMIPKGRLAFMSSVHPGEGDTSLYLIAIDPPKTNAYPGIKRMEIALSSGVWRDLSGQFILHII